VETRENGACPGFPVGIDVYATVRKHGFTINVVRTHDDEQHYFGLVLVD